MPLPSELTAHIIEKASTLSRINLRISDNVGSFLVPLPADRFGAGGRGQGRVFITKFKVLHSTRLGCGPPVW